MAMIKLEFRNALKEFLASSNVVEIEEDIIKNSNEISETAKKELMAALLKTQKLEKTYSGIPAPVNHKKAIKETLEKDPIRVVDEYQEAKKIGKKFKDDKQVQAQIIETLKNNEDNSREL